MNHLLIDSQACATKLRKAILDNNLPWILDHVKSVAPLLEKKMKGSHCFVHYAHQLDREAVARFLSSLLVKKSPQDNGVTCVVDGQSYPPSTWPRLLGVQYLSQLVFPKSSVLKEVQRAVRRSSHFVRLNKESLWLSSYYRREMEEGWLPALSIKWVNSVIGYGVFAREKIQQGSFVGEYVGIVRRFIPFFSSTNDYCWTYSIRHFDCCRLFIDAEQQGNVTRFVNHSHDPNLRPTTLLHNDIPHIVFLALREISPGEQLTVSYGPYYWKKRRKKPHNPY